MKASNLLFKPIEANLYQTKPSLAKLEVSLAQLSPSLFLFSNRKQQMKILKMAGFYTIYNFAVSKRDLDRVVMSYNTGIVILG